VLDAGTPPLVGGQLCGVMLGRQSCAGHGAVTAVGEGGQAFGQVYGGFGDDDVVAVARGSVQDQGVAVAS
jgi:hypothetical protein